MIRDLVKKTPFERDVFDSNGRKFTFTQSNYGQRRRLIFRTPEAHKQFTWKCSACGAHLPVKVENFIHDEVVVGDPMEQLDAHDCDEFRVQEVMDQ